MPAYIIVTREEPLQNPEEYATYQQKTRSMNLEIKPHPLVVYGELEALEGDAPDGVIMIEFENMDKARQWYHSEEYQQALPHRLRAARHRAFLVDGFTPPSR